MRAAAVALDAVRELFYRKTLVVYLAIVTLVLLFFALALRTDVADGIIASLTVFGVEGRASGGAFRIGDGAGAPQVAAATFVRWAQASTAFILYPLGILLSVFATSGLVPRMLERGTIDLLLSKPLSRPALFAARCAGGIAAAAASLIYLVGGLGGILALKTGVWNGGFLLSGLAMGLYFACLVGFMALFGVLFRSTSITVMLTAAVFWVSLAVRLPHQNEHWPLLITGRVWRAVAEGLVEALYHGLPRTYDFAQLAGALILGEGTIAWGPVLGSVVSGGAALGAATWLFSRKDF